MSLRLTCLGGAAAWPNPGQGCSSYLVTASDSTVLLDAGPNTLLELRKHADYSRVDSIVISHCHSDHILDLVPYRYGLTYGPAKPPRPIPLWLPPGGMRVLDALADALAGQGERMSSFWDEVFARREYDPSDGLMIGGVDVNFQRTAHPSECYAMRLTGVSGKAITYTADTGDIEPLVAFARNSDILIAEATLPDDAEAPRKESGHLTPSDAGLLARKAGVDRLVVSHLWSERPDEEVVQSVSRRYDGTILVATPGLAIDA